MRKPLCTVILSLVLAMLPVLLLTGITFASPMQYDETFLGELADKHRRLTETDGAKIVLIGGSSLAFGVDSALLEKYTGMPVVNYGLYATIGTKAMLDLSRGHIGRGDVVVLCPETDTQTYSLYYNAHSMWQAIDTDPSLFFAAGLDNFGKLAAGFPAFSREKLDFVRRDAKPAPSGIYAEASFNEYGDVAVERLYNEMPTNVDPTMAISLTTELLDSEFVNYINEYAGYCRRMGAEVYFSFPPMNRGAVISNREETDEFYIALGQALDFPLISDVYDYILPSAYFYDTNFHLNTAGASLRTALLADDILRAMGVTERVETVKTAPPKRPADYFDLKFEDDENARYFVFAEIEGGLAVTGLTEEGKGQKSLQIPRGTEGKAVLAIEDCAFADSAAEEIVIGKYAVVRSLAQDAFAGCKNLRRVELHLAPSAIPVSAAVLEAMPEGCAVYIPKSMYGEFATDYFWSNMMRFVKTME